MELTRKQIIWIAIISGLILLLTVGAILIFTPGDEDEAPEATAEPTATTISEPTPSPSLTPSPTVFLLPLVPQWDTPQPVEESAAGVFAPYAAPAGTAGPWVDALDQ